MAGRSHAAGKAIEGRGPAAAQEDVALARAHRAGRHPGVHRRQPFADVAGGEGEEVGRLLTMGRDDAQALPLAQAYGKALGRRIQVTIHPDLLYAWRKLRLGPPGRGRETGARSRPRRSLFGRSRRDQGEGNPVPPSPFPPAVPSATMGGERRNWCNDPIQRPRRHAVGRLRAGGPDHGLRRPARRRLPRQPRLAAPAMSRCRSFRIASTGSRQAISQAGNVRFNGHR